MASRTSAVSLAHEEDTDPHTVTTFISKVWKIVEKPEYNHLISWSTNGKTFIVKDYPTLAKEVLPLYFKHSNFNSFVRQLNLYGFRKVAKPEQHTLIKTVNAENLEFWHTNFRRGHPELLHLVQRKSSTQHRHHESTSQTVSRASSGTTDEKSVQMSKVMNDIHQMKGRQESIATVLDVLKQDNSHLRREIGVLKEKHVRQQRVLNKIIQFLVHLVYKGKLPSRRPRNSSGGRLMLMDSESQVPPAKRMRSDDYLGATSLILSPTTISDFAFPPDDSPQVSLPTPPSASDSSPIQPVGSVQSYTSDPILQSDSPSGGLDVAIATSRNSPVPVATTMTTNSSASSSNQYFTLPITSSDLSLTPMDLQLVSASAMSQPSPTTNSTAVTTSSAAMQFPSLTHDLLADYPIHPAPLSLLPTPHPENHLCINGHVEHSQQGIDALPDMLCGHLSLDPAIIADFLSVDSEHLPVPDYDMVDTARLLESLNSNDDSDISHESMIQPGVGGGAVVPLSLSSSVDPISPQDQPSPTKPSTPILQQLLESDAS